MKIIQVSDTHIVPPGRGLWGFNPRARLEACIADINAHHGDADLCIVTGDLTDRGEPEAYGDLREILATLRVPVRLIIGNHDNRDNFIAAFPEVPRDPGGFVQQAIDCAAGRLLLLDSHDVPTKGSGAFCAQRAAWLEDELEAAGARPVYLFIHHPPFEIGVPFMDRIRLLDPSALEKVLAGRDNIKHLFFGHVHRPISGSWKGIPFSALRSTVHQVPLYTPGPDGHPFCAEEPTYAVILLEEDRVMVHLHEFLTDRSLPADTPKATMLA
ncbi:MAG: phosphodiesterase [Pseudomonadota bacterium]